MKKRIGSAVEPFIVGQDESRRAEIEAQLFKDFEPKDVLEEIWLSDIAVLTTTIEYYRELEAAVTLKLACDHKLETHLDEEFSDQEEFDWGVAPGSEAMQKALGEFTAQDVDRISAIVDLITKMRRERERVYLLFERKRRPAVLNAVKLTEAATREKYAIENLSD